MHSFHQPVCTVWCTAQKQSLQIITSDTFRPEDEPSSDSGSNCHISGAVSCRSCQNPTFCHISDLERLPLRGFNQPHITWISHDVLNYFVSKMNRHQVLTGAANAGDHCYAVGSVEGIHFTVSTFSSGFSPDYITFKIEISLLFVVSASTSGPY